jgi:hypothetical protein
MKNYKILEDRSVSTTFNGCPGDHTFIISAILEAMKTMVELARLGQPNECVIRSEESIKNIKHVMGILEKILQGDFNYDEEDDLYDEFLTIFKSDLQTWWN